MPRTYIRHERQPRERGFRVYEPQFYDPYFFIQGSEIEKMVMTEFVRRGVYFEHTPQRNSVGHGVPSDWEADFLLPQYKMWVEIQGAYFHTIPTQIKADALRFAIIEAAGWKPIFWWEWDIRSRLNELMDAVPEFYRVKPALQRGRTTSGLTFYEGGDGVDHLAGLRTALRNRARPAQLIVRRRRKRLPK
jgi:hypothetical protein